MTRATLAAKGVRTIGDLAATPGSALQGLLGQAVGHHLGSLAANLDPRRVETGLRSRSVGAEAALGRRVATPDLVRTVSRHFTDGVASRLQAAAGRAAAPSPCACASSACAR